MGAGAGYRERAGSRLESLLYARFSGSCFAEELYPVTVVLAKAGMARRDGFEIFLGMQAGR
jgi:hypothetical protein